VFALVAIPASRSQPPAKLALPRKASSKSHELSPPASKNFAPPPAPRHFQWIELSGLFFKKLIQRERVLEILLLPIRTQPLQEESLCCSKRVKHHALVLREFDPLQLF